MNLKQIVNEQNVKILVQELVEEFKTLTEEEQTFILNEFVPPQQGQPPMGGQPQGKPFNSKKLSGTQQQYQNIKTKMGKQLGSRPIDPNAITFSIMKKLSGSSGGAAMDKLSPVGP